MTGLMYSYYTSIGFMPVFLKLSKDKQKRCCPNNDCSNSSGFNMYGIYRIHKSKYRKDENIDCFCICIYSTICTIALLRVHFNKHLRKNILCFYIDICICKSLWTNTCIPVRKIANRDKK